MCSIALRRATPARRKTQGQDAPLTACSLQTRERQPAVRFATALEPRHASPTTHSPEDAPRFGACQADHGSARQALRHAFTSAPCCFQRIVAGSSSATHTALQISLHGTPAAKASSTVRLSSSCRTTVDAQLPAYSPPSVALSLDHNSTSRMLATLRSLQLPAHAHHPIRSPRFRVWLNAPS